MTEEVEQAVLVIDDAADIHELVGARLSSEELKLLHAYDADEGFQIANDDPPDLILLDLDMPGKDGMTLCRELKDEPALTHIPVIFLTGTMDVPTKVRAFDLGATDYVTKPFDAIELKARVRAALRVKRYHDMLATKAQIDALTGLWNRAFLNDQLMIEVAVMARHEHAVSLVMVDIDHFKSINDNYGHPFGDAVIQRIAAVLSDTSRESDIVCRYGGEEFAIILRHTPVDGASTIAERLCREIAALELKAGAELVQLTASFGVAGSDQFETPAKLSSATLLKSADTALYAAKSGGRNRVERHRPTE